MKSPLLTFFVLILSVVHGLDVLKLVGGMREQRAKSSHLHDASTGTVTQVTKEQEEAGQAAMTCDFIMAKSVVLANEQKAQAESSRDEALLAHKEAVAEIVNLNGQLSETTEMLARQIKELESLQKNSKNEKVTASVKYDTMVQKMTNDTELMRTLLEQEAKQSIMNLEQKLSETQSASEATIQAAKNEWKSIELKIKHDAEIQIDTIQIQSKKTVTAIESSNNYTVALLIRKEVEAREQAKLEIESLQMATTANMNEIIKRHSEEQNEKESQIAALKKEATATIVAFKHDLEETTYKLAAESESNISNLQILHDNQLSEFKAMIEEIEKRARNVLEVSETNAAIALAEANKRAENTLSATESRYVQAAKALKGAKTSLEETVVVLQKNIKKLEKRLNDAVSDVANWEELHGSRSYCNLTHISVDTMSAVATASVAISHKLGVVTDHGTKMMKHASKPHLERIRALYDLHLNEPVGRYVIPVYEHHLTPWIEIAGLQVGYVTKNVGEAATLIHQRLIEDFKVLCPRAQRELRKIKAPVLMIDILKQHCRKPKVAIDRALIIIFIMCTIIFRKAIWRTTMTIVWFPFNVAWYCFPLRFLFRSKTTSDLSDTRLIKEKPADGSSQ